MIKSKDRKKVKGLKRMKKKKFKGQKTEIKSLGTKKIVYPN